MTGSIDQAVIGLGAATLLGASIGFERQWRQRMASNDQLSLRRLDSTDLEDSGRVEVSALLTAQSKSDAVLERVDGRLSLEQTVSAASWSVESVVE
jgi:uncharacterized membrane protein YhiD involved in acid resistance